LLYKRLHIVNYRRENTSEDWVKQSPSIFDLACWNRPVE
jgi:hypothetical protein